MATSRFAVHFRRRREGKTDFRSRRQMLYSGKPRFVVRTSLRYVTAQVTTFTFGGDLVAASATSKQLAAYGWKGSTSNTSAAYLTGLLCGMRAKKAGISEAILDIGMRDVVKGAKIFATLKGFSDAEVDIPFGEDIVPDEDRISGKHIVAYYESLDEEERKVRFSNYLKEQVDVTTIPDMFEQVKAEIIKKGE
jgi:large subunit ribosomal protein L18